MNKLRDIAALNGNLKRLFVVTGAGVIYSLASSPSSYAEEPATPTSEPTTTQTSESSEPATVTVETVQTKVETAETTLSTAVSSADPVAVSASQPEITDAQTAINSANTAIAVAETAAANVVTATETKETATTELATAQTALTEATTAVNTQQAVVTTETSELTALQNTPSESNTYTTSGYVAPVAPETPTVTTTTLPPMWDAATKIETPFDIKMGDTVYEGQGTNSQIYVTSKATITFGTGDFNWWDFPAGPHISVYASDFMSAGTGASITVTTTETTLAVDWDLHKFGDSNGPITNVNWTMTVNPETGEWTGVGTVAGNTTNLYNGPRIGVRETAGAPVQAMTPVLDETLNQQISDQQAVVTTETAELTTLQETKTAAETVVEVKTEEVVTATAALNTAVTTAEVTLATANSLANTAVEKVATAVAALETNKPIPVPPTPPVVIPDPLPELQPVPQPPSNPEPPAPEPVEPETVPELPEPVEPETVPELPEPVEPPSEGETPTPEPDPVPEPEQPSDVPTDVTDSEGDTSSTELPDTESPSESTETESDQQTSTPTEEPSSDASSETDTSQQDSTESTQENQSSESSQPPTSPDSLPESTPLLPPASALVAHVQVDQPGVANGGIQFFGTKSQPQVVGEDGKLTPPPPPPGSGLPIPPDAITTADTFIGQPGGTTFNAPDIAVPVEVTYVCETVTKEDGTQVHLDVDGVEHQIEQCTFLPAALDAIPGAGEAIQAMSVAFAALSNIGNDMSPITRKKAKKVLVATLVVGQIAAFRRKFGE